MVDVTVMADGGGAAPRLFGCLCDVRILSWSRWSFVSCGFCATSLGSCCRHGSRIIRREASWVTRGGGFIEIALVILCQSGATEQRLLLNFIKFTGYFWLVTIMFSRKKYCVKILG